MKLRQCLKSALRRQLRVVIVLGLTGCCVVMLFIATLFSPLNLTSSDHNMNLLSARKQRNWINDQSEFDGNEQFAEIKRKFFVQGNVLFGDKVSAMGLIAKVSHRSYFESGVNKNLDKGLLILNKSLSILSSNDSQKTELVQSLGTENRWRKKIRRRMFQRTYSSYAPIWKTDLYYNHSIQPLRFKWWTVKQQWFCGRRFNVYAKEFALLLVCAELEQYFDLPLLYKCDCRVAFFS